MRCQHCEEEVEEGREFCPHCGQSLAASGETISAVRPASSVSMSSFERSKDEGDKTRRVIYIVVALAAAALIAAGVWVINRPKAPTATEQLAGAIRPGTPEFEQYKERLIFEFDPDENASKSYRALGDIQIDMRPIIRNFTGKTISGLEFHAAGFDLDKRVIRERIAALPVQLDTSKVLTPNISLVFPKDNQPASLKLELTGVTFK